MATAAIAPANETGFSLEISRVFNAPRELVFQAFTQPEHLQHWLGPRGFQSQDFSYDLRVGGRWRACLHQTGDWQGKTYPDLWQGGEFLEFLPPERLVYTFAWDAGTMQPTNTTLITVTFKDFEDGTLMEFTHEHLSDEIQRDGHRDGWNSTFDRLADFLQQQQN